MTTLQDAQTKARNATRELIQVLPDGVHINTFVQPYLKHTGLPPEGFGKATDIDALDKYTDMIKAHVDELKTKKKKPERKKPVHLVGDNELKLVNASSVKMRNVDFIWDRRLARGKFTLLAGVGGLGKSQLLWYIAAVITQGAVWPDGGPSVQKGRVLILSAEDVPEDTLVPRLAAANADLSMVEIIELVQDPLTGERRFDLQKDLPRIRKAVEKYPDIVAVLIDPVSSFIGKDIDSHNNSDMRSVLDPLNTLAGELKICIAGITHFNKSTGMSAAMKVMGSAAFVNAARAVFAVLPHPDDNNKRVFAELKNNMAKPAVSLVFHIEEKQVGTDDDDKPVYSTHLTWDGEIYKSADEIMQRTAKRKALQLGEAIELIRELLADGPMKSSDVEKAGKENDISWRTMKEAKKLVPARSREIKAEPKNYWVWEFPDEAAADFDDDLPQTEAPELQPWD